MTKVISETSIPNIVGIVGKKGSGKDTVAEYLWFEYLFTRLAFADKLKEVAKDLFNITAKDAYGRYVFQQLGSKMREIKDTVWIDYVFNIIEQRCVQDVPKNPPFFNYVISDVRYFNEAERIWNENGVLIILDVDSETRKLRCSKRRNKLIPIEEWEESEQHESETGVDEIIERFKGKRRVFILDNHQYNTKEKVFSAVRTILNLKERE